MKPTPEVGLHEGYEAQMNQEHQQWQHEQLTLDQAGQDQTGYMDSGDQALDMLASDLHKSAADMSRGTLAFLSDKQFDVQFDSMSLEPQPDQAVSARQGRSALTSTLEQEQDIHEIFDNLPAIIKQRVTAQAPASLASEQKKKLMSKVPMMNMGLEHEEFQPAAAKIKLDPRITDAQREG